MSSKRNTLLYSIIALMLAHFGYCMECYVCENQDDNTGKCLKTIKTCNPDEDMCLTEIKWGTQPYWSQGAKKQYYISKKCASKKTCERVRRGYMPTCTHLWYQDWKCAECCAGDRCNYFVITGSSAVRASTILISASVAIVTLTSVLLKL